MNPERWQRLSHLLDAALDLPSAERAAFLEHACGGDAMMRKEIESLLRACEREDGFLDERVADFAAPVIVAAMNTSEGAAMVGARIGPYRIVRAAGRGGMGAVYLAERADDQYRKQVALKLVAGLVTDELIARFREERQILATLEHPGIARLVDGGVTADGLPWFAMEWVEGTPLDQWADERRLTIDQRLELFLAVCDAVQHAHSHHIVHRDLKPSNILVSSAGQVKLLDFGIAKLLEPELADVPELTRAGTRLLTPQYASPEQLRGEAVSPATDLYSLGVLLHHLLSGRHPHDVTGRTTREVERAILEAAPAAPSSALASAREAEAIAAARASTPDKLGRRLKGNLDAIVLKALRKEPADRYATAAELADDVRAHLTGGAISARRDRRRYAARLVIRRHRNVVLAGLVAFTALALGGWLALAGLRTPARRFYEEGIRAYNRNDLGSAALLFHSALAEDSSFAMAAYYAARVERELDHDDLPLLVQALRASMDGPKRERLIIRHAWANITNNPANLALAESLATRFPRDAEALFAYGHALAWAGDVLHAMPVLRRVIDLDSGSLSSGRARCAACDAFGELIGVYQAADSFAVAERTARAWVRAQPRSPKTLGALSYTLELAGRTAEAQEAERTRYMLDPGSPWEGLVRARIAIRAADFATADRILQDRAEEEGSKVEALWWLAISLRQQHRFAEAHAIARRLRSLVANRPTSRTLSNAELEAQVLFEMGSFREAAALFDSIAVARSTVRVPTGAPDAALGMGARHRVWMLTHVATAIAAAGDTARLPALADTIERLGRLSAFGRDRLLHHHVRGLLAIARGQNEDAVAQFREAIVSPSAGFTRTNLELARLLTRLQRSQEAIPMLQAALRGPMEANGLYATHTELHGALADAFTTLGMTDSAAVHVHWVQRASAGRLSAQR